MVMIDMHVVGCHVDLYKKHKEGGHIYDQYGCDPELIEGEGEEIIDDSRSGRVAWMDREYSDEDYKMILSFGIGCKNHWKYKDEWINTKPYDHRKVCGCDGLEGLLESPYDKKHFDLYMKMCKKYERIPFFSVHIQDQKYLHETPKRKEAVDRMIWDLWDLFARLDEEGWVYIVEFPFTSDRERIYAQKPYIGKTKNAAKGEYASSSSSSSSSSST